VLRYFGLEKLKKVNVVGHFDKGDKIAEKKIPVSTRTPVGVTIRCVR
jgi:hypothetical protein